MNVKPTSIHRWQPLSFIWNLCCYSWVVAGQTIACIASLMHKRGRRGFLERVPLLLFRAKKSTMICALSMYALIWLCFISSTLSRDNRFLVFVNRVAFCPEVNFASFFYSVLLAIDGSILASCDCWQQLNTIQTRDIPILQFTRRDPGNRTFGHIRTRMASATSRKSDMLSSSASPWLHSRFVWGDAFRAG